VFAPGGEPRVVFEFVVDRGRISEIAVIAEVEGVRSRELVLANT
jgi:hypothetical protein